MSASDSAIAQWPVSSPQRFEKISDARAWCRQHQTAGRTVGLVPTMGALHEGHLSLVRSAMANTDVCAVSIFVNPTQFSAGEDLSRYPRPLKDDLRLLADEGVHAVFTPTPEAMYPPDFGTSVVPPPVARLWEGQFRPTHFSGVATVVLKLFQILPADKAFFGQKDFQQWRVIQRATADLNVPTEVIGCPIVRDADGLALSSRNMYLAPAERRRALAISASLMQVRQAFAGGERVVSALESVLHDGLSSLDRIDYAVIVDAATLEPISQISTPAVALVAGYVGSTRLIDNQLLGSK